MSTEIQKKSSSVITIILLLLIVILVGSIGGYILYNEKNEAFKDANASGTKATYKEGKVERFKQNFDYTNALFPDLFIPLKGEEYDISQIDRTEGKKFNYTVTLSKPPSNLLISFYSDNGSLDVGGSCFRKDDLIDLSPTLYREKMKNFKEETIGYVYMQKEFYTLPSDKEFQAKYDTYKKFMENNGRSVMPINEAVACSFAPRTNKIKTSFEQDGPRKNKPVLARFMIDSINLTKDEQTRLDNIMIGSKIK
jgi:hypothetical protein